MIDLQSESDDDHRCIPDNEARSHRHTKHGSSPTQNMDDDHSGYSHEISTTNSHESEGDISWLGRVYL